jgi:hypothetical protein
VYDARDKKLVEHVSFDSLSLMSPAIGSTSGDATSYADSVGDIAHSFRVYKGKIFLLVSASFPSDFGWQFTYGFQGRHDVQVGTLLTWADRVLSFVQDGNFLSAIDLTRSYYVGDAPGNTNGLPDDLQLRRDIIGQKMHELMVASARYAFSEDRMTDGTHVTPDGRGVDRTSLFEGLVATCARACIALHDLEFLFENLYQYYEDNGISRIFLMQLEPFVLDNQIRTVPPRITQRLVALHDEGGQPDLVERIIWHIDPSGLDIDQAIQLCQRHNLYDALIYVYTRALRDFVSPVVELLGLIRRVHQFRNLRAEAGPVNSQTEDATMEPVILNAYKIYPYLANVLSGLSYPSEEPLSEGEAFQAKRDVYTFLFFGRSSIWPVSEDGKLVLTSDEEGGIEPTFPYARALLRFDPESFLHSLDIAFEDTYLNDETQGVSRLVIVKTLLEILASSTLPPATATFVNIFIARNVPKYPQFIQIAPTVLHNILIGLAEDPDSSTREDRQLAAEYLLSVYTPHESSRIIRLFEAAGFFRILRAWHRHDQRWVPLLSTYLRDSDLRPSEVFDHVDDVLEVSTRLNRGTLPDELLISITSAIPELLVKSVTRVASLVDKHVPELHQAALDTLSSDGERLIYLYHILGPPRPDDDEYLTSSRNSGPSVHVPSSLRQLFITYQCQYHPAEVIDALKYLPSELVDWTQVLKTCEDMEVYDAVVWALNWRGNPHDALSKGEKFERRMTSKLANLLASSTTPQGMVDIENEVKALEAMGKTAIAICLEHSQGVPATELSLEDLWFQLLQSQIHCVQVVSAVFDAKDIPAEEAETPAFDTHQSVLSALRGLVQESFGSFVSVSSTRAISFPRLFERLVDSATQSRTASGTLYTEFRVILTGMLESYRSEEDMLTITRHLVDRDLFETVEDGARERARGWGPPQQDGTCSICRQALVDAQNSEVPQNTTKIVVSRSGPIYHQRCSSLNA